MVLKEKDNAVYTEIFREEYWKGFEIFALEKETKKIMGFLNFNIKDDNRIWLWKIETKQEFQHQGIGQALLDTMEYFAATHSSAKTVEGKYYPLNEYAKPFYEKNNYKIICYDQGDWEISKDLKKEDVLAKIEPKIMEKFYRTRYPEERKHLVAEEMKKEEEIIF